MDNKAELEQVCDELARLNNNLILINESLETQGKHCKQIASALSEIHYLLQFNLGVNVNSTPLFNISEHLKEIKDKL